MWLYGLCGFEQLKPHSIHNVDFLFKLLNVASNWVRWLLETATRATFNSQGDFCFALMRILIGPNIAVNKINDNPKRFILLYSIFRWIIQVNFTIKYFSFIFFIHLNIRYNKMNLFGLSFILFILKWSAGKRYCSKHTLKVTSHLHCIFSFMRLP